LLAELTSDAATDAAYAWLCKARIDHPDSAVIWGFRRRWAHEKETLKAPLAAGTCRFDLLRRITLDGGEHIDLWSAPDALVLKTLRMVVAARHLPVSASCTHLKGHGGLKGAVRKVWGALAAHRFVLRTDVKSYYDSIDHDLLMAELSAHVDDPRILNLLRQ
jgi:RNA-directed DNA polymerase